jgi:hypothetical protein
MVDQPDIGMDETDVARQRDASRADDVVLDS